MITAAALKTKLTIEKPSTSATANAAGHVDQTNSDNWTDLGKRMFEVVPRSGREFVRANKMESTVTHVLKTYYDSVTKDIDSTYRLKFQNATRYLNVTSVWNVDERNKVIEVHATEAT